MQFTYRLNSRALVTLIFATAAGGIVQAQEHGKIEIANPHARSDGTMSAPARAALTRGRLLKSDEESAMKDAANREAAAEIKTYRPDTRTAPEAGQAPAARAPAVVGGHSFAGQSSTGSSPSDSTGTIGPFSYIQAVNTAVRMYNRGTNAVITTATLNQLAGISSTVNSFDPQIMWDPTTNRFYYVIDSVFSKTDNKLSFGFSKTNNPTSFSTADWCKYTYTPADPARFPDYPKLGDNTSFIIIGVNSFRPKFVGSDLIAISKPPAGTTCPAITSFKIGTKLDLRDTSNQQVFTPVPANQVDNNNIGYVIARHGSLPATKVWFFSVAKNSTGNPTFGAARGLTVPSYTIPPGAQQPGFEQLLDTLDARHTQAMQAINPDRNTLSFWVQHTVKHPTAALSIVRWYEINPVATTPVLLRSGQVGSAGNFYFNASISSDRRKDQATTQYGDSFVLQYNLSSSANNIAPRIQALSSFNGGSPSFLNVKPGVGGYRDFTCPNPGDTCRWGDYSSAMPDPRPTTTGRGAVWITNQYSGLASPPPSTANFRTWISALQP